MKTINTFIAIVCSCMLGYAQTTRVQVGDLFYNLSGATASVTTSDKIPTDCRVPYPSKYTKDIYIIPSHISYGGLEYEVVAIDKWAFAGFRNNNARPIVQGATGSKARTIILPPTIKRIGESAFANCTNLISMIIPASVESLHSPNTYYEHESPFYNTPLLRELIYLSPNAPSGWHAVSKTCVPNLDEYSNPSTSIADYSILPISSANESSFVYSGEVPSLTLLNNMENYKLEYNAPALEKNVGSYDLTIDARIVNDYISYETSIPIHYDIKPAEITVSMSNVSREYGNPNPEFDIKYEGWVNNETIDVLETTASATTPARQSSNVGTYPVSIAGAKAHNYTFKYIQGELIITKANLELSVNNATKTYGSPNPYFTLSYLGLKNNENSPKWNKYPTISTSAEEYSDIGTYEISASGGDALNYNITKYNSGILTIDKADQTLTWNQNLYAQVGSLVTLNAISSAGLSVSYELSPNNVAQLYNDNGIWYLNCLGSGTVNIQAIQNGDKNHNAAMVSRTFVVFDTGSSPQIVLNVEKAGSLPSLISENRKYQIKNLRLTGFLNGTDIKFLREMAGSDTNGNTTTGVLETLDISECTIVSGGQSYYKSCYTYNNRVSDYMFYGCKQLVNLLLPEKVLIIGDYALADCDRLSLVFIPNEVKSFGYQSFRGDTSLRMIPMPQSLTLIDDMAFMGCNGISEITLPLNVRTIGANMLKDCRNISQINVESGNSCFVSHHGVLYTHSFEELLIFPANHNFTSYTINDGTQKIAADAFVNAKNLTDVVLPSSLQSIGRDAFIGCDNLSTIQVNALTPPICENDCFEELSKIRCKLKVPKGCYSNYWVAPVWSEFNKIVENESSGIDDVTMDDIKVSVNGFNIVVSGVPNDVYVRIYQLNGLLMYQQITNGEDISYRPAANGIYIVVVGNKVYKIMIE